MNGKTDARGIAENRKLAFMVLAACVLLSVFVLGGLSLARERGNVLDIYARGSLHDGLSVKNDLTRRGEESIDLAALAFKYLGEDDADASALMQAGTAVNETDDINERLAISRSITAAQAVVYEKLGGAGMSETDARDARLFDRNITDALDTLSADVYFDDAEAFNRTLDAFPANLISGLMNISDLPVSK